MKNLILLMPIMLFAQSCLEKDDVLPKAIPSIGNKLKFDGYYHQINNDNEIYRPLIMYCNGVLINVGGFGNSLEEMDEYIKKNYIQDAWYKNNKYKWGVFYIEDNFIRINQLSQDYPHREFIQEGVILNDTTFKITKYSSRDRIIERDEVYHFRQFSPKPDSTNVFIK